MMTDYFGAVGSSQAMVSPDAIFRASGSKMAAILFTHLDEAQQRLGLAGDEPRVGLRTRIGDSSEVYWDENPCAGRIKNSSRIPNGTKRNSPRNRGM
jgi:hypothetical protein